ncbi:MAG: PIN domain-containing protein [Bacteroidota bacterium]
MRYVLDTNILVYYIKDGATRRQIDEQYNPFGTDNEAIISVVTIAELKALAVKNGWGEKKQAALEKLVNKVIVIEVKYGELLQYYAEIDGFSQGKIRLPDTKFSARNMGKNDIWIAATTRLVDGILMTSDHDFDHLNDQYFKVLKVENID